MEIVGRARRRTNSAPSKGIGEPNGMVIQFDRRRAALTNSILSLGEVGGLTSARRRRRVSSRARNSSRSPFRDCCVCACLSSPTTIQFNCRGPRGPAAKRYDSLWPASAGVGPVRVAVAPSDTQAHRHTRTHTMTDANQDGGALRRAAGGARKHRARPPRSRRLPAVRSIYCRSAIESISIPNGPRRARRPESIARAGQAEPEMSK
jgi:hypothetical protein